MKKFFLFFASVVLAVGMTACGGDEPEIDNGNPDTEIPSRREIPMTLTIPMILTIPKQSRAIIS